MNGYEIYGGQNGQTNFNQQPQRQTGTIINDVPVNAAGIEGANWYPVAANHTLIIFDTTAPIFRIKTNNGYGVTLKTYEYKEIEESLPQTEIQNGNNSVLEERVTSIETKLDAILQSLAQQNTSNNVPVNRNNKQNKGGNS